MRFVLLSILSVFLMAGSPARKIPKKAPPKKKVNPPASPKTSYPDVYECTTKAIDWSLDVGGYISRKGNPARRKMWVTWLKSRGRVSRMAYHGAGILTAKTNGWRRFHKTQLYVEVRRYCGLQALPSPNEGPTYVWKYRSKKKP